MPGSERSINARFVQVVHLPYIMASVSLTTGTCKYIPIHDPSNIPGQTIAFFFGIKTYGMIFVHRLSIEYGLYQWQLIIMGYIEIRIPGTVSGLVHIEVEPVILMEPGRRSSIFFRLWMKAH